MKLSPTRVARALKQLAVRPRPQPRNDSGLTTLEWLLIVAAVAGLAALAVVLVQRVVGDTSDQIAGGSARKVAAQIAAQGITDKARDETVDENNIAEKQREFKSDCKLLEITYGDVEDLDVYWHSNITTDPFTATADLDVTNDAAGVTAWNGATKTFGCIVP